MFIYAKLECHFEKSFGYLYENNKLVCHAYHKPQSIFVQNRDHHTSPRSWRAQSFARTVLSCKTAGFQQTSLFLLHDKYSSVYKLYLTPNIHQIVAWTNYDPCVWWIHLFSRWEDSNACIVVMPVIMPSSHLNAQVLTRWSCQETY